jgi:hypothetical protein
MSRRSRVRTYYYCDLPEAFGVAFVITTLPFALVMTRTLPVLVDTVRRPLGVLKRVSGVVPVTELPVGVPRRAFDVAFAAVGLSVDVTVGTLPDDTVGVSVPVLEPAVGLSAELLATLGPAANVPAVCGSAAVVGVAAAVLLPKTAALPVLVAAAAVASEFAAAVSPAFVPPTATPPATTPDAAAPSPAPLITAGVAGELMLELIVTCGLTCRAGHEN